MKASLKWLSDYVTISVDADELSRILTMAGLEVEEIIRPVSAFSGVYIGEILNIEKHPDADKLRLCEVAVGNETVSVVCGAPNVKTGMKAPIARPGAVLPGNFEIKPVTIRGVQSYGMLCSAKELGIGDNSAGILELDQNCPSGELFVKDANKDKNILFDINITPNRPDCLSHLGIAREIAALTDNCLIIPEVIVDEIEKPAFESVAVMIKNPVECPRYCARVIRDVQIQDSPEWLKERLLQVGVRPINNVVDITNFVLMETGHPLHAFDYDQIEGRLIIVRTAKTGEMFTTLDNIERKLNTEDLLICDNNKPVALAGVMGGLNSEVTESTRNILLESAYFNPSTVRRTAKRLGLSTEASQRFERGADPEGAVYAINRAVQLMSKLADGKVEAGIVDAYPGRIEKDIVDVRISRVCKILGESITIETVKNIFQRLGLFVKALNDDVLQVSIPLFRHDLKREIDLIEEVIRLHGFENISPSDKIVTPLSGDIHPKDLFIEQLKDFFTGAGFYETWSASMVSKKHVDLNSALRVINPLSPETGFLRTSLLPNLFDSILYNYNRSITDLKLYETGRIFQNVPEKLPHERLVIAGACTGSLFSHPFWKSKSEPFDFYHLKGIINNFIRFFKLHDVEHRNQPHVYFHTQKSIEILCKGDSIGYYGQIHPSMSEAWDLPAQLFLFEFDINQIFEKNDNQMKYHTVSRYPAVCRDLAFIVHAEMNVDHLVSEVFKAGGEYLVSAEPFDLYQGGQIAENQKSIAITMTFVSCEKTLTDQEIEPYIDNIIKSLNKKIGAVLRS